MNPPTVRLRDVVEADLAHFFDHQRDPVANQMAAFTAKDPANRAAFLAHWRKVLASPGVTVQTILRGDEVAGYVLYHDWFGDPEVSYWLERRVWGQGVATVALMAFVAQTAVRPLYARAVHDNIGSLRVLEKCGFVRVGTDHAFAQARGRQVEEIILRLD
ncbi:MAG: GNAT family N-acetyltransferase [Anaerolineales bacterium]|nr:GNAT family N-acetyltransferase [Anaerolineales bacterium]